MRSRSIFVRVLLPAACVLGILPVAPAAAQIGVSPPRFDLRLEDAGQTETLRLFNYGRQEATVEVVVRSWDLDEDNQVRHLPPDEQSLDQWLVINPLRFTVAPGRSQAVRFSVRPRVEPTPGEHRAMIYFNELAPAAPAAPLRALFSMGVAVYATAGVVTRQGTLVEPRVTDGELRYELESRGSSHVRFEGGYSVVRLVDDGDGDNEQEQPTRVEGRLPTTPVLPATRRTFRVRLADELAAGRYVLRVDGTIGDDPVSERIPFAIDTLPPPPIDTARR